MALYTRVLGIPRETKVIVRKISEQRRPTVRIRAAWMTCCAIPLFLVYEKPKTAQLLFRKRVFPGVLEIGVIFGGKCIDFSGVLKGSDCLPDCIECIDHLLADIVTIGLAKDRRIV